MMSNDGTSGSWTEPSERNTESLTELNDTTLTTLLLPAPLTSSRIASAGDQADLKKYMRYADAWDYQRSAKLSRLPRELVDQLGKFLGAPYDSKQFDVAGQGWQYQARRKNQRKEMIKKSLDMMFANGAESRPLIFY
ncbi:hypothetical protein [Duganella sp. Root1480D1]|uniref:hypothetical protein n=1 Tax=Duganella sp. Root1480D1 TaxID=1736471 RepID=UPI0012E33B68|nr:hypothetical protein [Duganella sp. Root1480D1]